MPVFAKSFLYLKAEVAKKEIEWEKNRSTGKDKFIVGGIKRPDKVNVFHLYCLLLTCITQLMLIDPIVPHKETYCMGPKE